MRLRLASLLFAFLLSLWSCGISLAATLKSVSAEIQHLTGLLLASPENRDVADALRTQSDAAQKKKSASSSDLALAAKALNLHHIQFQLTQCLKKSGKERELANRILGAASLAKLEKDPCDIFKRPGPIESLNLFSQQLDRHHLETLKTKALEQSQLNIAKTYLFWQRRIDNGQPVASAEAICAKAGCSEREKLIFKSAHENLAVDPAYSEPRRDPKKLAEELTQKKQAAEALENSSEISTDELLLMASSLKSKKRIQARDVLEAQTEVTALMLKQFNEVKTLDLNELVKTNPAAIGQVLLQNPELSPLVCRAIQNIVKKEEAVQRWEKIYFWGGIAVGGTLLATGVASAMGVLVLSETALTGLVVAGATFAVVDSGVSATRSYQATQNADSLRASFLSQNGDSQTKSESQEKVDEAFSHLISAGIGAASLVPFGSIWKFMGRSAQAAKVGSARQIAKISAAENEAVLKNLKSTLKEIQSNPALEKVFINARGKVKEEDFGDFMGHLSQLSPELRKQVLDKMKAQPEKAARAIEKGAQAGREVCK